MAALVQQMMLMNSNFMNTTQQGNQTVQERGRSYGGRGRGRGRNRGGRGGGRGRYQTRPPRIMRYCWSCGWQTHDGEHCYNRQTGHQVEATIDNRMGGSNLGFPPGFE